ncbi:major capsid protein [Uliginosibacterium gangwonense]|uniref:major capsid protein n=1 Tax=Uliginosibacterium gangwonense TaxID=392736 RepID=UPI00036275F8|nr:major capsid protein [Uliginosibacterium gangwonense]
MTQAFRNRIAVAAGVATLSAGAFAAAGDFDMSAVTTVVTAVTAAAAVVGGAILAMKVGGKAYKWIASFL